MKKSNSRLLLIVAMVLVAVFAMSSFVMAAGGISVKYYDADGNHIENYDGAATLTVSGSTSNWSATVSVTTPTSVPTKTGYTFTGWKVDNNWGYGNSINANTTTTIKSGITCTGLAATPTAADFADHGHIPGVTISLTATYTPRTDISVQIYDQTHITTPALLHTFTNQTFGSLLTLPDDDAAAGGIGPMKDEGWIFLGWKDRSTGVVYSENAAGEIQYPITTLAPVLDAVWVADEEYKVAVLFADKESGVLYDKYFETAGKKITVPGAVGDDVQPAKEGYTFQRTWTSGVAPTETVNGGAQYTVDNTITFYADFLANDYTITKNSDLIGNIKNGGALANLTQAHIGDKITFEVTPTTDYAVNDSKVKVTDANGNAVVLVKTNETTAGVCTYEFTMPANNVTLTAGETQSVFTITNQNNNLIGTIKANNTDANGKARVGDYVTFEVTPTTDNAVDDSKVKVTDAGGNAVALTKTNEDATTGVCTYAFTMPANNVNLNAGVTQNVFGITALDSPGNYTMTTDPALKAKVGDLVKITIDPVAGKAIDVDSIKVQNALGTVKAAVTQITTAADGTVTAYFTMPAAAVTVTATASNNVFGISVNTTNTTTVVDATTTGTTLATTAVKGNVVQFKVTPNTVPTGNPAGVYNVNIVKVVSAGGKTIVASPIAVDTTTNTVTYAFTMPGEAVTITTSADLSAVTHTIYLLGYDNTLLGKETVNDKDTFSPAAKGYTAPTRTGYTFDGWFVTKTNNGAQLYGDRFSDNLGASNYSVTTDLVIKQYYEGAALTISNGTDATVLANTVDTLSVTSEYTKSDNTVAKNTGDLKSTTQPTCATQSGANVKFTVKSKPNYKITDVTVVPTNTNSTTVIPTYKVSYDAATDTYEYAFTMPAEDVKIVVYTEALPYTVSVTETGDAADTVYNNTYTINGNFTDNQEVKQGETATVKVNLIPGYKIKTVTAIWKPTATTTSYCDAINLTNSPALDNYAPNAGETEFQFVMPQANVAFAITYEKVGYTVNTTTSNNATYNNIGTTDPLEKQGYVIATDKTVAGAGTVTTDLTTAQVGDLIQLDVTPQAGYKLTNINVVNDANGELMSMKEITKDRAYQFNMPANGVTVTATFEKLVYTVNFVDQNGNTVNSQKVEYLGTPVIPTKDPIWEGYDFLGWASDDVRVPVTAAAPSKTAADFVVVKDTTINAVFDNHNYNIVYTTPVVVPAIGGFDSTNPNNADYGDEVAFVVQPATGYQIKDVVGTYVNAKGETQNIVFTEAPTGDALKANATYKFIMPACNTTAGKDKVTIKATFEEITYDLKVNVNEEDQGTVYVNGSDDRDLAYAYDKTINVSIKPNEGWILDSLTVQTAGGTPVTYTPAAINPDGDMYSFKMPADAVTVTVNFTQDTYNISYNNPANGTISLNDTSKAYQSTATFTATPNKGYQIASAVATYTDAKGVKQTITFTTIPDSMKLGGAYTFKMPNANVDVKVLFEEQTYTAKLSVVGDGSANLQAQQTTNATSVNAKYKEVVTVTATPDPGYELTGLTVNEATDPYAVVAYNPAIAVTGGTYTFEMPADSVNIVVTFTTKKFDITYNTSANGDIAPKDTSVAHQATAKFTATPAEGYQIDTVTGTWKNKAGVTQNIKFDTVPPDLKIGGEYTFTMPEADVDINVTFTEQTYTAKLTVTGRGSANLQALQTTNATSVDAKYKETVTVKATADAGYELTNITVNKVNGTQEAVPYTPTLDPTVGTYTFEMPADSVNVVVTFTTADQNITYNNSANGTIDPKDTLVAYEDTASFTVTPNEGYEIDSVTGTWKDKNDVTQNITFDTVPPSLKIGGEYTFTMPAEDVAIVVSFKEQTYNVDLTLEGKAKVDLNNVEQTKTTALFGSTVTVNITPETGWELKSVSAVKAGTTTVVPVDPTAINANGGVYSLVMPSSDVSISVKLAKKNNDVTAYSISFTGDPHGTISIPIGSTADYGDTVNVISDPDDGYRFKAISVKAKDGSYIPVSFVGQTADYVTTHSFTMPDCAVEIYVTFTQHSASRYTDVRDDDWYYEATEFVSDRGYFVGTTATLFEPKTNMTRAMFVTVLSRLAGVDTSTFTTTSFNDVKAGDWFAPAVAWASTQGIIKGYGNGEFGPNDDITREQMANIMLNFCTWSKYDVSVANPTWINNFSDKNQISAWAMPSMTWAVSSGMMHGKSATILDPLGTATRAEVAQVVKNLCDKVVYE